MHRRRLRRTVVRRAHHPAQAPGRRLRARTVQRPDFRVQGRGAADPAALHGAHHAGRWRRGREDHDPHRHLRRHRQGRAGRLRGRPGHRDHRLLPGRQGLPGPGAADDHASRLQRAGGRRGRQLRRRPVCGQAHLRRPRPGRASRRQFARGAFLRQLHQRGPSGAAGRLLLLRLRPTARRPGDQRRR